MVRQDWSPCISGPINGTSTASGAVRWLTYDTRSAPSGIIVTRGSSGPSSRNGGIQLAGVALATCSLLPDLDGDERLLIPALAAHGVSAEPCVWDDPAVRWHAYELVVVRSTWDYADRRDAFLAWCVTTPALLNAVDVITWNTDKRYLRELEHAGIPIVPTTWITAGDEPEPASLPGGEVVVKPSISAGARNTSRYPAGDRSGAWTHVRQLLAAGHTVMVQPYLESVDTAGETGLIFIDGVFSHAVRKGPVLRVPGVATDRLWAPEEITRREPDADERAVADATLNALPWPRDSMLYARVDLVRRDDGAVALLELELTEPSLFLGYGPEAAARLATGIARRLHRPLGVASR